MYHDRYKDILKVWLRCVSVVKLATKYCIHLFLKSSKTRESLAKLPWPLAGEALPWKRNRFIYAVHYFHFKVWLRAGNIYFFSNLLTFCLLYFYCVFLKISVLSYAPSCPGTGNVFWGILYFHSCGIVGKMTVLIHWLTFDVWKSFAEYELWVTCGILQTKNKKNV